MDLGPCACVSSLSSGNLTRLRTVNGLRLKKENDTESPERFQYDRSFIPVKYLNDAVKEKGKGLNIPVGTDVEKGERRLEGAFKFDWG